MKSKIGGIILIVLSTLLLVGTGFISGFYNQIVAMGFIPDALILISSLLSITGIGGGVGLVFFMEN